MTVARCVFCRSSSVKYDIADSFSCPVRRGLVGFGTGGEYPASSVSAIESSNQLDKKNRGWAFILVTNLVLTMCVTGALRVLILDKRVLTRAPLTTSSQ